MTSDHIFHLLSEAALHVKVDLDPAKLRVVQQNQRTYNRADFDEFKQDFTEAARNVNFLVLEHAVEPAKLDRFVSDSAEPVVLFYLRDNTLTPELVFKPKQFSERKDPTVWLLNENAEVITLIIIPYKEVVSQYAAGDAPEPVSPVKRFFRLLSTEKKDIGYIIIYALFIGLLSLVLPLGLQNTVELISGGVFFSSVYLLIALVIAGIVAAGVLQIVQISLVEHLQRRIFVKAAFEFAFRIPRIRLESLAKHYAPELINRFFDVINIQKGLPKLLLDLSSGVIQVFFGLLLLSLYHPFFVFFSFFLLLVLTLIFFITGPRGLHSSINESKYKYKVVQWLEELARAIKSFKLAGNTELPLRRTDHAAGNYLKYRKTHFRVLLMQFSFFVFFKVAVAGGLLIMGTILVVNREITLGQFVASEVIIILVLNAVEKIILYMDVVYDMLTAVDKIAHVTDLPIERTGGFDFPRQELQKGYHIRITDLSYQYEGNDQPTLDGVQLNIASGEKVCIAGPGGSGKTTLTNVIAGLYSDYTGGISVNNFSMRDLDLRQLRDKVAKNISPEDIFDGTIYENITIGKTNTRVEDVLEAIERVGLNKYVNSLPEGLNTLVSSGGKELSSSTIHRLILARCLAKKPALIILNDFFSGLGKSDKLELMQCVIDPAYRWTLIAVSNDPLIMAACDRVIVLDHGKVVADGPYQILVKDQVVSQYFE